MLVQQARKAQDMIGCSGKARPLTENTARHHGRPSYETFLRLTPSEICPCAADTDALLATIAGFRRRTAAPLACALGFDGDSDALPFRKQLRESSAELEEKEDEEEKQTQAAASRQRDMAGPAEIISKERPHVFPRREPAAAASRDARRVQSKEMSAGPGPSSTGNGVRSNACLVV